MTTFSINYTVEYDARRIVLRTRSSLFVAMHYDEYLAIIAKYPEADIIIQAICTTLCLILGLLSN